MEVAREEIARYCEELQNVNDSKRQSYLSQSRLNHSRAILVMSILANEISAN